MRNDDRSYFVRRAKEESEAAQRAECPKVAAAHRELAERYAQLIGDILEQPNEQATRHSHKGR